MRFPWAQHPRGSQLDHWVDRPDVEVQQCMKLTGTNKPITYYTKKCVASTVQFPRYGRETTTSPYSYGGHSIGETPGPIPNPEAKPNCANGTARETPWESRTPPDTPPIRPPQPVGVSLFTHMLCRITSRTVISARHLFERRSS
jgi:hypothetical protein